MCIWILIICNTDFTSIHFMFLLTLENIMYTVNCWLYIIVYTKPKWVTVHELITIRIFVHFFSLTILVLSTTIVVVMIAEDLKWNLNESCVSLTISQAALIVNNRTSSLHDHFYAGPLLFVYDGGCSVRRGPGTGAYRQRLLCTSWRRCPCVREGGQDTLLKMDIVYGYSAHIGTSVAMILYWRKYHIYVYAYVYCLMLSSLLTNQPCSH